ncbi:VOC family protein [Mucilaginibacter sp. RS28]|uniref:VOC family protein n=1 Tax=Mucilaginibacter straminoryzae TaxID=2932774 RepID=A0A9X1X431_9SPHI|nr:VOC family protein [Mucilaginibacter straminoryzae]MCJ8210802.1 VOC family protein [Mucilaginibacter straminoryzae]
MSIQIKLSSVMVKNQETAAHFYTNVLGFVKKQDVPMGEHRWLTVVSPESDEVELLLEAMAFAPAQTFQAALYEAGIPATGFAVSDIQAEYERLNQQGVSFKMAPTAMGPVTIAILDDNCGNWIQLYQMN